MPVTYRVMEIFSFPRHSKDWPTFSIEDEEELVSVSLHDDVRGRYLLAIIETDG